MARRLDLLEIMQLVKATLYCGQVAPTRTQAGPWNEKRDWGIAKQLVKTFGVEQVTEAIRGLALLRDSGKLSWARPRSKMTLRALTTAKYGDHSMFHASRVAWAQQEKQRKVPVTPRLRAIFKEMGA